MMDEISAEKKVCIKRKIHHSVFSILIFENITLLVCGMMFEICWVSRDIIEDDKNNDRIFFFLEGDGAKENEYKRIAHEDKFEFNTSVSRRCKYYLLSFLT